MDYRQQIWSISPDSAGQGFLITTFEREDELFGLGREGKTARGLPIRLSRLLDRTDANTQRWTRRRVPVGEAANIGSQLWSALPPSIRQSLEQSEQDTPQIRVKIVTDISAVADLPWEWLFNGTQPPVALRSGVRLIRAVPARFPIPAPLLDLPLRVLLVMPNPEDERLLNPSAELNAVMEGLNAPQYTIEVLQEPSAIALAKRLTSLFPHVVHYIGHGGLTQGEGNLILHDTDGRTRWVSATELATLLPSSVRLICLSTPFTTQNYQILGLSRLGRAPRLVELPTTIANQYPVGKEAAGAFWRGFYSALPVVGGDVTEAAHRARIAAAAADVGFADWASFSLTVRGQADMLFATRPAEVERTRERSAALSAQFAAQLANDLAVQVDELGDQVPGGLQEQYEAAQTRAADLLDELSIQQLQTAVETFDRPGVDRICTELIAHLRNSESPPAEHEAGRVLALLQRKRYFQHLQRVADALVHNGLDRPFVRRRYAQALLDQEMLTAGLSVLDGLVESILGGLVETTTDGPDELAEARGLVGRANKQLYVLTGTSAGQRRHAFLRRAIDAYYQVYREEPQKALWHGINTAALLKRAASDGVDVPGFPLPGERGDLIAREVLDVIVAKPEQDTWDRATAMEACIALGQTEDALRWLSSYVDGPYTDAFELSSTLRQLIEVWGLREDREPGARLLPLLRAKLLEREGGEVTVRPSDLDRVALDEITQGPHLEQAFDAERFQSLGWFKDALERCRAVARIEDAYADGIGTGFLVEGSALHPSFPEIVLVTNAHVIPEAISPGDAFITFRALGDVPDADRRHRVQQVLWVSPSDQLDAAIVSLESAPPGVTPCPTARELPPLHSSPSPRMFIVGHASGRSQPMFSMQDNLMLDYDDTRVHYRAPTEQGSSGSPIFDREWRLIAVHHAGGDEMPMLHGGGTYQANEGIWMGRIKEAIQDELSG